MTRPQAKPRGYAAGTDVTVERSRAELDQLLTKHGATSIGILRSPESTLVVFELGGYRVRHTVKHPDRESCRPPPPKSRNQHSAGRLLETKVLDGLVAAELRRRWRALLLITKAKLELIEGGDSTVESEFMADVMLPGGQTVGDHMLPRIESAYRTNTLPPLNLGSGK